MNNAFVIGQLAEVANELNHERLSDHDGLVSRLVPLSMNLNTGVLIRKSPGMTLANIIDLRITRIISEYRSIYGACTLMLMMISPTLRGE